MSAIPLERRSLTSLLYADRVAMVYRLAPLSLVSVPFIGLFAWWAGWRTSLDPYVTIWFAGLLAVTLGRVVLNHAYRKAVRGLADAHAWGRRFTCGAFATGAMWGIGGVLLFRTEDPLARMILAFLLPGVAAAGIATLGPLKSAYRAFVLPLVTPVALYLFAWGDAAFTGIALASMAFTIVLMGSAARYSRTVEESLLLRFENLALLDSLSQSKERLERINTRLHREAGERAQTEKMAREQSRRVATYVEQTPLAVMEMDLHYRIVAWNPAAEVLFGYRRAEVLGKSALDIIVPRDAHEATHKFVAELKRGKRSGTDLLKVITRSGRMMVGEWHVSTVQDDDGRIIGLAAAVLDVTERRHLDRMKNEFITAVSHELHGPLATMRTAMGTLASGAAGTLEAQAMGLIRTVQNHCERLASLTEAMLDVEHMEAGSGGLAPLALADVARRAVADCQALAERREVRVDFAEAAPEALVEADGERLQKVFASLIHNAIKFSPEGGQIQVSLSADDRHVRLSIADRGMVIPNEFQVRVMQKLSPAETQIQRSSNDISLGLFLSRRIIEKQGGTFSLESCRNAGNTFHIDLPRCQGDGLGDMRGVA